MMFLGINIFLWIAFIFSVLVLVGVSYVLYWTYKSYSVQKKIMEKGSLVNLKSTKKTSQEIAEEEEEAYDDSQSFFSDNDDIFSTSTSSGFDVENEPVEEEYVEETALNSKESITLQEVQYEDYDKERTGRLSSGRVIQKINRDPSKNKGASSIWDTAPEPEQNVSEEDDVLNDGFSNVWDDDDSDEIEEIEAPTRTENPFTTRRSLRQQERGL